eukprot:scaffold865_cov160-Ochromonas_danica.AAC.15
MFGIYRRQIVEKAERMGLPWRQYMEEQREALPDLSATAAHLHNPNTTIPQYFHAPVHAYKEGNLCWESAMEEDLWSKLMIAPLFDNALDGDVRMRRQWLAITARAVTMPPQTATDLGCGTGLSMYMLDSKWPSLQRVVGVDLSTFKLSVCEEKKAFMVRLDHTPLIIRSTQSSVCIPQPSLKASKYQLRHEAAEGTSQPDNSQDLVTFCLVAHESPKDVSKAIFAEAFRILRPGGVFTMLDLDKNNLEVLLENPFVAAIYKRTEPYMSEFLLLEPTHDLVEAGFEMVEADNASKSHRVFVARKPCL